MHFFDSVYIPNTFLTRRVWCNVGSGPASPEFTLLDKIFVTKKGLLTSSSCALHTSPTWKLIRDLHKSEGLLPLFLRWYSWTAFLVEISGINSSLFEFSCFVNFFVRILKTREEYGFLLIRQLKGLWIAWSKRHESLVKLCPRIPSLIFLF